jgi:thiamine pyrophosphokinase
MNNYSFLREYNSILCLNGTIPEASFFAKKLPIIAADGAANKLASLGIKPNAIIGDLDSFVGDNHIGVEIIYLPDQNKTDFEKALDFIDQKGLAPCLVTGVSDGFIDHILNNINIIINKGCSIYAPPILGYVLNAPYKFNMEFKLTTKISLFGISKTIVKTKGLKWELNNQILTFPGLNSVLNRTIETNITIEVIEGNLLLLIYVETIKDKGLEL